jgi:hypothetical protein
MRNSPLYGSILESQVKQRTAVWAMVKTSDEQIRIIEEISVSA